MKAILTAIAVAAMLTLSGLQAQWVNVNEGLTNTTITALFSVLDTVYAGTDGGGVFKIYDNSATWVDVSGNIGNLHINDLRGGGGLQTIWAATDDGAFSTATGATWVDQTGSGLSSTDLNYFWFGDYGDSQYMIGTNGAGAYKSANVNGPWIAVNNGISGAGLVINDISGYRDNTIEFAVLGTDGGVYLSTDSLVSWTAINGSLSGDELLVKKVGVVGTVILAATRSGLWATTDFGQTWLPFIPNDKFNTLGFVIPTGLFMFGERGFVTTDFVNINEIDLTGVSGGEVTAFAVTPNYLYIGMGGTTAQGQPGQTGGIYRLPISQLTAIDAPGPVIAESPQLLQNYPNPFNPATTISYRIPRAEVVRLAVYDVLGRAVQTLVDRQQAAGEYSVVFDAGSLTSGIYFYQLQAGGFVLSRKMMLVR